MLVVGIWWRAIADRAESPFHFTTNIVPSNSLLLVELQLHYDLEMPRRMQAYAALAEEKYRLPVYPLVLSLGETRTGRGSFDGARS